MEIELYRGEFQQAIAEGDVAAAEWLDSKAQSLSDTLFQLQDEDPWEDQLDWLCYGYGIRIYPVSEYIFGPPYDGKIHLAPVSPGDPMVVVYMNEEGVCVPACDAPAVITVFYQCSKTLGVRSRSLISPDAENLQEEGREAWDYFDQCLEEMESLARSISRPEAFSLFVENDEDEE